MKALNQEIKNVKEGLCEMILPDTVFYNPVQEFNRDITILAISTYIRAIEQSNDLKAKKRFQEGLRVLDALSATGMRAIRYAKEIIGIKSIIANDLSEPAIGVIQDNIKHNNVQNLVITSHDDANLLMLKHTRHNQQFDIIDLDPYGSAVPFMGTAFQSIAHGGLLCVTCTDMGVLCGATGHNCYGRYDAIPLHTKYAHEMSKDQLLKEFIKSHLKREIGNGTNSIKGLRIVLHSLESHANKCNKYIVPLLCLSIDFYVRLFVRVYQGAANVHISSTKRSLVYHCNGCTTFTLQPMAQVITDEKGNKKFKHASGPNLDSRCKICSSPLQLGGPVWNQPLHDRTFVDGMIKLLPTLRLGTKDRIHGLMAVVNEELLDVPLYYKLDRLSSALNMGAPKMVLIKSAILNAGYRVSISHASPNSIKTDAPHHILWDIMRCWAKRNNITAQSVKHEVAKRILSHEPKFEADFSLHSLATPDSMKQNVTRFPELPPNWGPQTRVAIVKRLKTSPDHIQNSIIE